MHIELSTCQCLLNPFMQTRSSCRSTNCSKPELEPIMLSVLLIILSRISHIFYPLFLFYSHAITYYSCYILKIFILSVTMRSTVYLVSDKIMGTPSVIKIDITKKINSSRFFLCSCVIV